MSLKLFYFYLTYFNVFFKGLSVFAGLGECYRGVKTFVNV